MTGGVASRTVSETFAVEVFPDASCAVTTIVSGPVPTTVPGAGFCVRMSCLRGVQLSLTTTFGKTFGTRAEQLASAGTVNGPGTLEITGAAVSTTVNETLAVAAFPPRSLTVTKMECGPVLTTDPATGSCVTTN